MYDEQTKSTLHTIRVRDCTLHRTVMNPRTSVLIIVLSVYSREFQALRQDWKDVRVTQSSLEHLFNDLYSLEGAGCLVRSDIARKSV